MKQIGRKLCIIYTRKIFFKTKVINRKTGKEVVGELVGEGQMARNE